MLANTDPNLQEAVLTVYHLTQEEKVRQQCEAREDYYRRTVGREKLLRQTTLERDQAIARERQAAAREKQAIAREKQAIAERDRLLQILREHNIDVNE